jgi:hypothetical protein
MGLTARKHADLTALVVRHLNHQVGTGPEAVQAKALTGLHVTEAQRPVTHHTRTQQRRGFLIVKGMYSA